MCLTRCQYRSSCSTSAVLSQAHLLRDQEEQDASAEQSVLVNQAYAVLKSPLKRALYLVREQAHAGSVLACCMRGVCAAAAGMP